MANKQTTKFGVMEYDNGASVFEVEISTDTDGKDMIRIVGEGTDALIYLREWVYLRGAVDAGISAHMKLLADIAATNKEAERSAESQ